MVMIRSVGYAVKVIKKHASGGQGINFLDPRFVTMTGLWPVMVTIKFYLPTFYKMLAPGRATGGKLSPHGRRRPFFRVTLTIDGPFFVHCGPIRHLFMKCGMSFVVVSPGWGGLFELNFYDKDVYLP